VPAPGPVPRRAAARRRLLVAALLAATLAGCGFHLRGAVRLPEGLRSVYVQASSRTLGEPMELYLEAGGARIAKRAADADLTLVLGEEVLSRRLLAVDPQTGKGREYELGYALDYRAGRSDGSAILPAETVRLVRQYSFNPTEVIAKGEEEEAIYSEMRQDAIQQVLRRLRFAVERVPTADAGQR
jgi:LPS-assembly lipoprotein